VANRSQDCFQFRPELGLKTTVGAFCFAEEKPKKNAEVIEQVGGSLSRMKHY
jgi:amidase